MFAESVVLRKLVAFEETHGWRPVPHTISDVDKMNRHLDSEGPDGVIVKSRTGNIDLRRPLTKAEKRWIANERALCAISCEYFLTRYYMIASESQDGGSNVMHFAFRSGQRVFFNILQKLDEMGVSKEVFILKARKQGISTLVEGIIAWGSTFIPGTKGAIASADGQKSQIMAGMFFFAIDELPWWLESTRTRDKRHSDRGIIEWSHIGNVVMLQSGSMRGGIGQGTTPNFIHLCLSGHTLVRSRNGRVTPIKELQAGDVVLSSSGEIVPILNNWKSQRTDELTTEIEVWGNPSPLSCTRDHKILLENGWTEAKSVKTGDMIVYPVRPLTDSGKIKMMAIRKGGHRKKIETNDLIEIPRSFELGRICGLYVAEGSILRNTFKTQSGEKTRISGITFALDCSESEEVRGWIDAAGFKEWLQKTNHRTTSRTATVHNCNRGLAEWLLDNFGEKDSKTIPDICWNLGREFAEGVVWGYLYGDGHFPPEKNEVKATSIRPAILFGLRELIASLGYGWSQITWRPAGMWCNRNCQSAWVLSASGTTSSRYRKSKALPYIRSEEDRHWRYGEAGELLLEVSGNSSGFARDFYDIEIGDESHAFTTTCGVVHNSECSQFTNAVQQIDEGLLKAVTSAVGNFMALETTGDGDDWTRKMWQHCKEFYWRGMARLLPLFLPWFMTPELYPSISWIKKFPIPKDFKPIPETEAMIAKCEAYVASTEILQKVLGKGWKLPVEQQWWWQFEYLAHKSRGIEKSFTRQHPCDDFEALIGDNDKAVGEEAEENMARTVSNDCRVYMVAGEGIEKKHEPKDGMILYGEEAVRLYSEWTTPKGEKLEWGFVPVQGQTIQPDFNPLKKVLIFEEPQPGYDYGIGCDTGTGVELDRSAIIVTRSGGEDEPDVQVAEFADDTIGNTELYAWLAALTALYSRYMKEWPHPKLAIELRRKFGDMSYHQMRLMGFYRHHDFIPIDRKTFKPVTGRTGRPGWWTNVWSRPMLLNFFTASLENGWYEVKSRYLQQEIKDAEMKVMKSGQTRMDHASRKHDDRIFGAAMSHFTLHGTEVLAEWSARRYRRGIQTEIGVDYSPAGTLVNVGSSALFGI